MSDVISIMKIWRTEKATGVKVRSSVKTGHEEERVVRLDLERQVTLILDIVAAERGCSVELVLVRAVTRSPLHRDRGDRRGLSTLTVVTTSTPCRRVLVTVNYRRVETRSFKRGATVEPSARAIGVFKIDPSMATNSSWFAGAGRKNCRAPSMSAMAGPTTELLSISSAVISPMELRMIADPGAARAATDLEDVGFRAGCDDGRWRIISFVFPILDFVVSATRPDGTKSEYGFSELSDTRHSRPKFGFGITLGTARCRPSRDLGVVRVC